MQKTTFLLSVCFILYSCNSVNIESLETKIIQYQELPKEVKEVIFDAEYIDLNKTPQYDYVSKQHWLLSWVYDSELHRKSDGKIFKLEFINEHRSEYIIYKKYLFVPRHYNIYKADSLNYSFSRFKLE